MYLTVKMRFLVLLCYFTIVLSDKTLPRIIVIGTGPSGIAAATRLLENGFNDLKILEAENRIGGRVYTTKFENNEVDMGGQWVVGEKNNVVYELAWPMGLLSHAKTKEREGEEPDTTFKIFGSSGEKLSAETAKNLYVSMVNLTESWPGIDDLQNGSMGEYLETQFNRIFDNYPEITEKMRKPLMTLTFLSEMADDGGEDIYKVSARGVKDYKCCEGNALINWRERGYGMIFNILMKKYPNPQDALPIMDKIMMNKTVTKIKYENEGPVKVMTSNGDEFEADYVILTVSLGVLQAHYETLIEPRMTPKKINTILNLGMGHNGKIYLYYEDPWWLTGEDAWVKSLFWMEDDRKAIENDPEKRWMLSVYTVIQIEYKPHLLCLWMAGPNINEMEKLPEDVLMNQVKWLLNKFYGDSYNLTEPKAIKRTQWNINENFRGTYSYRTLDSDKNNARAEDLAEPIMRDDKPIIMFAGEATSSDKYATVNGAIETGWREADRLINYCKNNETKY